MMFSVAVLVLAALLLPVALVLGARRWSMEEAELDTRLHSPQAHTVVYIVPEGQDPALVRAALTHAGFSTVLDRSGDQRLMVECDESHRAQVRAIIEGLDHTALDDCGTHVGPVRFEDETV
jgi:hypothetical protein